MPGKYASGSHGNRTCNICDDGEVSTQNGASSCTVCGGKYANDDNTRCEPCGPGMWSEEVGLDREGKCKDCPIGWYRGLLNRNASQCISCEGEDICQRKHCVHSLCGWQVQ